MNFNISKYINNVSGLQIFQLLRFGILLLINIVFAKNLSVQDIGIYQTLIFIAGMVTSLWISGIIQSFLPLHKNNKAFTKRLDTDKSPEIFNLFVLITFISLLAFIIVYLFERNIAQIEFHTKSIPYLNLLLAYIFLSGPTYIIEYIYLIKDKPKSIIIYGIISFSVQFILISFPLFFNYGLYYCLWGLIGVTLIRVVWLIALLIKYSKFEISLSFIKEHFSLAVPLILSAILSGSSPYINGIIISSRFDESVFAVFRYGAMELPLVVLLANAFSNAMVNEFNHGNTTKLLRDIKTKSLRMMNYLFPITILFLLTSNWLYPHIFSHDFSKSAGVFNVFLITIISRLIFPQTIIIGLKHTKVIMLASLIEIIVNISLCLILINYYGIIGVAFATFFGFVAERIFLTSYCWIYLKIKPNEYISLPLYFAYSIVTIIVFIFVM